MSNEELAEKRLEICKACPIMTVTDMGMKCDGSKWINKDDEWSYLPKEGFTRGCNCYLIQKTHNPNKHCPVDKW